MVTAEKTTVTRIMTRDGITRDGAKRKICPTYRREVMDVRAVLMTMFISMEQSWPTDAERLFSSPGLYFR